MGSPACWKIRSWRRFWGTPTSRRRRWSISWWPRRIATVGWTTSPRSSSGSIRSRSRTTRRANRRRRLSGRAEQPPLAIEPRRDFLARQHYQIDYVRRRELRRAAQGKHPQAARRPVQLARDARQTEPRVAGERHHRSVAAHQRQGGAPHGFFRGGIEKQLARRQAELLRRAVFHSPP